MAHHDMRAVHFAAAHLQRHRRRRQRPVERLLLPDLVGRVLREPRPRNHDLGDDLVRLQIDLPLCLGFAGITKNFSTATVRAPDSPNRIVTFAPSAISAGPRLDALTKYAGPPPKIA